MNIPLIGDLKNIDLSIIFIILNLFLLINTSLISGGEGIMKIQLMIISYLVGINLFRTIKTSSPLYSASIGKGLIYFMIPLIIISITTYSFSYLSSSGAFALSTVFSVTAALPILIIQGVTVAFSEQYIFQSEMPEVIGIIPAQILFGLFHFSAYGGALSSILVATVMGFIFYFSAYVLRERGGFWFAAGLHAAINLAILGVI